MVMTMVMRTIIKTKIMMKNIMMTCGGNNEDILRMSIV